MSETLFSRRSKNLKQTLHRSNKTKMIETNLVNLLQSIRGSPNKPVESDTSEPEFISTLVSHRVQGVFESEIENKPVPCLPQTSKNQLVKLPEEEIYRSK